MDDPVPPEMFESAQQVLSSPDRETRAVVARHCVSHGATVDGPAAFQLAPHGTLSGWDVFEVEFMTRMCHVMVKLMYRDGFMLDPHAAYTVPLFQLSFESDPVRYSTIADYMAVAARRRKLRWMQQCSDRYRMKAIRLLQQEVSNFSAENGEIVLGTTIQLMWTAPNDAEYDFFAKGAATVTSAIENLTGKIPFALPSPGSWKVSTIDLASQEAKDLFDFIETEFAGLSRLIKAQQLFIYLPAVQNLESVFANLKLRRERGLPFKEDLEWDLNTQVFAHLPRHMSYGFGYLTPAALALFAFYRIVIVAGRVINTTFVEFNEESFQIFTAECVQRICQRLYNDGELQWSNALNGVYTLASMYKTFGTMRRPYSHNRVAATTANTFYVVSTS